MPANNQGQGPGLEITKGIRVVEWLKTELVSTMAALFKAMLKNSQEAVDDALAGLIVLIYVLARRMGIGFAQIDIRVESKIRQGIQEKHEVEEWYGDLTALLRYRGDKKR